MNIGSIVAHVVAPGVARPAIVTAVNEDGTVDLHTFFSTIDQSALSLPPTIAPSAVKEDLTATPAVGTFHPITEESSGKIGKAIPVAKPTVAKPVLHIAPHLILPVIPKNNGIDAIRRAQAQGAKPAVQVHAAVKPAVKPGTVAIPVAPVAPTV